MANLKTGWKSISGTVSTVSPSRKRATLNAPRMLTPSEVESLRQNKQLVAQTAKRLLAA
jgi:hypothetical protein